MFSICHPEGPFLGPEGSLERLYIRSFVAKNAPQDDKSTIV
jgi:hypothetical protein